MRPKGKGRVKPKGKWAIRWYEDGLDEGIQSVIRAILRVWGRMDKEEGGGDDRSIARWLKSLITKVDEELGNELTAARTTGEVMAVIKPQGKWVRRWFETGFDEEDEEAEAKLEQSIERQIKQQIANRKTELRMLRRQVGRRFGDAAVRKLAETSVPLQNPEVVDAVFDAVIDCDTAEEFFAKVRGYRTPSASFPEA